MKSITPASAGATAKSASPMSVLSSVPHFGGPYDLVRGRVPATIALADGTLFHGEAFGAMRDSSQAVVGEMVFNTSMYGYQEILTDPSYAGQIMNFTYPHIGNVGSNDEDNESSRVHVEGVVVREISPVVSNYRSTRSLPEYLAQSGIMGVSGVDTRVVVAHLRDHGSQMGALAAGEVSSEALVALARARGSMEGKEYVSQVSCRAPYTWKDLPWVNVAEQPESSRRGGSHTARKRLTLSEEALASRPHVVALDCGVKQNILRLLVQSGFRVTVVPAKTEARALLKLSPDALFLSNGPGDPATLGEIVSMVRTVLGRFPIFGICLGHQILSQAVGAKTYKLKFGHRGGNHPVIDTRTGKVEITVQNHGFAVDAETLPPEATVTHINLNDQTVEGLELPHARAFSIQYHPEASPGPHDALYHFRKFFESVVAYRPTG